MGFGKRMKKTARSRFGGGGGNFSDRFKIPKSDEEQPKILFFKGRYPTEFQMPDGSVVTEVYDYGLVGEHFSKARNTGFTCTAGFSMDEEGYIGTGNKPCVGCYAFASKGKNFCGGARKVHVFNAILLEWFHIVDSAKKDKEGKPYKEYVMCKGKRCRHCASGIERQFGRRVYVPMGSMFVNTLSDFDLYTLTDTCECGDQLRSISFECPECGYEFIDYPGQEEKVRFRESDQKCPKCKKLVEPKEFFECDSCGDPRPLTLWNTWLQLFKSGEGVNTTLSVRRHGKVSDEMLEKVKDLMEPIDLDRVYPKRSLVDQAKRLKIRLPDELRRTDASEGWDDDDDDENEDVPF